MKIDVSLLTLQMKALSNETRLSMYLAILEHEVYSFEQGCMVCDVAAKFKLGAPTISHHIKILETAGLIHVQKRGKFICARINQNA